MNMILRELKASRRSLIFWMAGILAMVAGGMSKYGSIQDSGQSMNDMMAAMPKSLQALFGIGSVDLSTVLGYYVVVFAYVLLMAAIHAGLLGANVIAKEERDKTAEFLMSKPVSRMQVLKSKLAAALFMIVIFNSTVLVVSVLMVQHYGGGNEDAGRLAILMMLLYLVQVLFLSAGAAIAAVSKKPKQAVSLSAGVILITYLLSIVIELSENLEVLRFATPFKYFEAKEVLFDIGGDWMFIALSVVLSGVLLIVAFTVYQKRDLNV
ncbi:ABC transporter [Fictibacillus aquaticus]|uniref:ABC transporter n=2 Tax=Fictibacillus aquaticus TaxID=2021314 RepID=A0A235F6N4_9BACL|nr:ABC transporter [Fictibacillus aquaticus]